MSKQAPAGEPVSPRRLRIGIAIWLLSWIPFPLVALAILHNHGYLQSEKSSTMFVTVTLGIQYIIGFIGILIAGKEAIQLVQKDGTRKLPRNLWRVVIHGSTDAPKVE